MKHDPSVYVNPDQVMSEFVDLSLNNPIGVAFTYMLMTAIRYSGEPEQFEVEEVRGKNGLFYTQISYEGVNQPPGTFIPAPKPVLLADEDEEDEEEPEMIPAPDQWKQHAAILIFEQPMEEVGEDPNFELVEDCCHIQLVLFWPGSKDAPKVIYEKKNLLPPYHGSWVPFMFHFLLEGELDMKLEPHPSTWVG